MGRWLCAGLLALIPALALPALAAEHGPSALRVVQDRIYRLGVFLTVDALVENMTPARVDWAEVSVEFYNFFDELLSVEHTVIRPPTLGPGQRGSVRVVTPFNDQVRKIRYRFTWWQNDAQFQQLAGAQTWTYR